MTSEDRIETAAQLIHEQRHRMGYGQICDRCRQLAGQIARLYDDDTSRTTTSRAAGRPG